MIRRLALTAALGLALLPQAAGADPVLARYEVRAAGLTVMQVIARFDIERPRYQVRTEIHATGLASILGNSHQVTSTEGRWRGSDPLPERYRVEGTWRNAPRVVVMDWVVPGQPVVSALQPPNDAEREPVPVALQRETMDGLSALAKLARTVTETGRCETTAAVFDGRRRADYRAVTEGRQALRDGAFQGEALRCGVEMRMLAGRRGDQDAEEAAKPQRATAWLARPLADHAAVPVRIELPSRWFGTIRVVLIGIEPEGGVPGSPQQAAQPRR